MQSNEIYMHRCLDLAALGLGKTYPNPMVGAVIVHQSKIIGEGWHQKAGEAHAEVHAVQSVKDVTLLINSTLYVSLEPCAHEGKTPPCVDLILKHKIPNVVVGCLDPFSKVSGKSIQKMKEAGVNVILGMLEEECLATNKRFISLYVHKRPYIILKWAECLEGFIAPNDQAKGEPVWLISRESKILVHKWRTEESSILIGRKTADVDNPALTARLWKGKNPLRIVIDKDLKLEKNLQVFDEKVETLVFTQKSNADYGTMKYIQLPFEKPLNEIMKVLYQSNISSIIIEGGRETLQGFIDQELWDEARVFVANKKLKNGIMAPILKGKLLTEEKISSDTLKTFSRC